MEKRNLKTSITFLSQAAIEKGVHEKLGLQKMIKPVRNIRKLKKERYEIQRRNTRYSG